MGWIRFLLALIVIIAHTEPLFGLDFMGGKMAVQAFYIISGFYMALILNEKYIGTNKSYRLFLSNRLLRLYPAYWAILSVIILSSLGFAIYTKGESFGFLSPFVSHYELLNPFSVIIIALTNLFVFFQDGMLFLEVNLQSGYFFFQSKFSSTALNGADFLLIPPAWTIGLELSFYLVAPFIVRRKKEIIFLLIAVVFALRCYLYYDLDLNYTPWNFRFFPAELIYFLLGILSYKIYAFKESGRLASINNKHVFIAILILIFGYDLVDFSFKAHIFFLLFFLAIPFIFSWSKHSRIDRYVGELSYPIYLSHMFILLVVRSTGILFFNHYTITVIIISILAAILVNQFVSARIERYRQSRLK